MSEDQPFEAGAAAYNVSLPSGGFEGPLDLLLHLCQKHELDILDIPISFVTSKYLEYIAVMQILHLDVAAEYLVMAATLAHIKSKMLLPAPPPGQEDDALDEEEDPRQNLIARLLAYQKYKLAGEELASRGVTGRDAFVRGTAIAEAIQSGIPPLAEIPLYRLVEAFQGVVTRSKVRLTHDIVADRISISDRIHQLTDILRTLRRTTFDALFDAVTTPFELVITFLALLEMSRLKMTRLTQTDPLSTLYVELADSFASDIGGEFEEGPRTEETGPDAGTTDPPEAMMTDPPEAMMTDPPESLVTDVPDPLDLNASAEEVGQDVGEDVGETTEVSSMRGFDEESTEDTPLRDGDTIGPSGMGDEPPEQGS